MLLNIACTIAANAQGYVAVKSFDVCIDPLSPYSLIIRVFNYSFVVLSVGGASPKPPY